MLQHRNSLNQRAQGRHAHLTKLAGREFSHSRIELPQLFKRQQFITVLSTATSLLPLKLQPSPHEDSSMATSGLYSFTEPSTLANLPAICSSPADMVTDQPSVDAFPEPLGTVQPTRRRVLQNGGVLMFLSPSHFPPST